MDAVGGGAIVRLSLATAATAMLVVACPGRLPDVRSAEPVTACSGLDASECGRARGLIHAATAFGNVRHEYLLDAAGSFAPGRGVQHSNEGAYSVLPTRCAQERAHGGATPAAPTAPARVDASTVDFTYVGLAIDQHIVSADADLLPWVGAGAEASEKKLSLVAIAFVRDLDPQFFGASDDVAFSGDACTCGRATHFVGAVKVGGVLSYEMRVRSGEVRGRALEFFKARLAAGDTRITQTVIGGLEVDGLDLGAMTPSSAAAKPLAFRVKNPVPIAYALYPLSDVCKFAFPAPEVSPEIVELGDVPYGREETRLLHVVNRAAIDLRATIGERTFAVPALGSADVPFAWSPNGQALGCEIQTREEILQFVPAVADVPVTPRTQSVRVTARVRTGKGTFRRHEHIDTGVHRKPDYAATKREWTCPDDYAVAGCRTESAQCGDGRCTTDGYAVNAELAGNGCRFACAGPEGLLPGISSMYCRFDAVMDCRLRCR
ncbi:MAG: hypothetical protein KF819_05360 [Labilithrix sp.]|nr:hypothetical protein [Labilithrix sp.]